MDEDTSDGVKAILEEKLEIVSFLEKKLKRYLKVAKRKKIPHEMYQVPEFSGDPTNLQEVLKHKSILQMKSRELNHKLK